MKTKNVNKIKQLFFAIICTFIVSIPSILKANSKSNAKLPLKEYISEVLENNPYIKSLQAKVNEYEAQYHYTGVIPDPSFMFKINNIGTQYSIGKDQMSYFGIELDQTIPFPVKLHLESEIAYKDLIITRKLLAQKELEIELKAVSAFSDYYYDIQSLALLKQYLKVIDTVINVAKQRYETGIASQQDILRAMLERSRLEERIALIELDLTRSTSQMNSMLGRTPDAQIPEPHALELITLNYTENDIYNMAKSSSPELIIANIELGKNKLELSKSKWSYAPDLDLGIGWMTRGYYPPGWTASIGISLPLYFWAKQRYMVKSAEAGLVAAKQNQTNIENTIHAEIDATYKEAQTNYDLINLYKDNIIPQATLTFSSAINSYTTGRVDFLTVMDALLMLIDYKQILYQRTADYYKSLAHLSVLSGVDLIQGKQ